MNRFRLLGVAALTALTIAPTASYGSADRALDEVDRPAVTAAEGLITLAEENSPFIAFNVWVKAGSQNDPAGKEGLAALTAAVLSDGSTQDLSYQEILEALYPMAAGYGASVDKEMTVFRGYIHEDNLEGYYEIFRAALLEPAFAEEDFERVKSQLMNFLERGRRFNRDEELSKELLYWMAYRGTPYEHPEEGYVQSVRALTLDDVKAFYREHYVRNNIVVGVGGGYAPGFPEKVRADFDALPAGEVAAVPAPEPRMPDGVEVLIVEKQTDASAISFGFPIDLLRSDDDFVPLMLANAWFGEHRSSFSHLYQVIRERRGMNYGDYSYIEPFPLGYTTQQRPVNYSRRSNLFEIWIRPISRTGPDDLHDRTLFATRAGWRELDKLVENGLPEDQVERARLYLHNFSVTYGSTVGRRLAYAMDDAFYGMEDPGYLALIRPELAELTKADVDAAVRKYLQSENMYLVFITADAEAMKQKLLSGEPTSIAYAGEPSAEIQAEDEEIASFAIPVDEEDITIIDIMEVFEGGGI
jgi:zinc protease